MRKNYERSGDVEFQTLLAVVGGTAVNLLEFVNTLTLYESVDSTFMTGSLVFTDANNVLRGFDFRNDTYILGSFRTPLPDQTKDNLEGFFSRDDVEASSVIIMKVAHVSRTKPIKQNADLIELTLVSPTFYIDQNKKVSRSVKGVGMKPVLDLMEEFYYDRRNPDRVNLPDFFGVSTNVFSTLGGLFINNEVIEDIRYEFVRLKQNSDTETEVRYAFPFQHPSAMIRSILNDLVSKSDDYGYKMWETLTGFKVGSLQDIQEGRAVIGYNKKFADTKLDESTDDRLAALYDIESIDFKTVGARLPQMQEGAFFSKMYEFDITNKQIQRRFFNYDMQNPYVDKLTGTVVDIDDIDLDVFTKFPITQPSSFQDEFSAFNIIESMNVTSFNYNNDKGEPDPNLYIDDEGHLSMISHEAVAKDTEVEITVPGNHIIEAGMIVNLNIPPNTISEVSVDEDVSGDYLVNSLSHFFEFQGNTHRMGMSLTRNFRTTPIVQPVYPVSTSRIGG